MKLTHIRLAGFKSFAEPTVIVTPGQRIAVVGPNGCGKSNLIDAVRWVLGESRASNLRGEAMQDVIFSGTSQRKPLARASVELVFEQDGEGNTPWSIYRELSVKRVMTREGDSTYFINNQPVRRKDVTDLFLGSGLGSRSYAIIEQGMISRIIESKPEEMRTLMEDAAGIARYRERRKESESRLHSAREQLQRLTDVRQEWLTQHVKLEEQAMTARQFLGLQSQKAEHEAAVLWCAVQKEAAEFHEAEATLIKLDAEREQLQQRYVEAQMQAELLRTAYDDGQLNVREAQQAHGQLQLERAQLAANIREIESQYANLEEEWRRLDQQQLQLTADWATHESLSPALQEQLAQIQLSVEEALEKEQQAKEVLTGADEIFHAQQKQWSEHQQRLSQIEQQRQTLKVREEHVQKRLTQLAAEEERIQQRLAAVPKVDASTRTEIIEREQHVAMALEQDQQALALAEAALLQHRGEYESSHAALAQARAEWQSVQAKYEAIKVIEQERATSDWSGELGQLPPFWADLTVEAGWERAVEVVLRERFHARSVSSAQMISSVTESETSTLHWGGVLWSPEHANEMWNGKAPIASKLPAFPKGSIPLLNVVKANTESAQAALQAWCATIALAPSLELALEWQRSHRLNGCIAVTQEGVWVDAVSVQSFVRPEDHRAILALKSERALLEQNCALLRAQCDELEQHVEAVKDSIESTEKHLNQLRQTLSARQQEWHHLNTERRITEERVQRNEQQLLELGQQRRHSVQQREHEEQDREALHFQMEEVEQQYEVLMSERERLRSARNEADVELSKARAILQEAQQRTRQGQHDLVRAESAWRQWEEKHAWLTQQKTAHEQQVQAFHQKQSGCASSELEPLNISLRGYDERLASAAQALKASEQALEQAQHQWKAVDELRLQSERALNQLQAQRERSMVSVERARVAWSHSAELMEACEVPRERVKILAALGEASLKEGLGILLSELEALGPVNLVALDEVEGAKTRLNELESQHSDVEAAVLTLEEAIRRLDSESRQRLREALEGLNRALSVHFSAMFGGGTAQLVPTSADLLSAGIQLWAEPPGKKNVSLHLLSGGEKALTAISLMLALFELNPAPFCLLDEVDAPLDDVNTARLAKMIVQLSGRVQCVFISHHRLTMEVAEQLVGVTMPEAGVSKVVEVDMQSALAWAGAQKKKGVEAHG